MASRLQIDRVFFEVDGKAILEDVSLGVEEGETLGLLGPSGSGKTTLLRLIAGLETPGLGTISWDGHDLAELPTHLRRFGLMFQDYALFPHLDVAGNIAFGLKMAKTDTENQSGRIDEVLAWVGLLGMKHRPVRDLSGGEKQRVALARTLAPWPRLVMLDEPLGSLDRLMREELKDDLASILEHQTAVYVTHDQDEAEAIADVVALIDHGRIIQKGRIRDLRANPVNEWVSRFLG